MKLLAMRLPVMKLLVIGIVFCLFTSNSHAYSDFYQENKRGWFWFEESRTPEEKAKEPKEKIMNQGASSTTRSLLFP